MTKHGVLKYLFIDGVYPQAKHRVTGEYKDYWEIENEWNKIASSNVLDQSEADSEIAKALNNGTYKPNKKKDKLLWDTGWHSIYKNKWNKERFKINV